MFLGWVNYIIFGGSGGIQLDANVAGDVGRISLRSALLKGWCPISRPPLKAHKRCRHFWKQPGTCFKA